MSKTVSAALVKADAALVVYQAARAKGDPAETLDKLVEQARDHLAEAEQVLQDAASDLRSARERL